jgi:hypothetical protein
MLAASSRRASNVGTDYIVRLKCPYGDRARLLLLENREENLKQVLEMPWDFECPVHGVQREIPLEGSQKSLWSNLRLPGREEAVGSVGRQPRSSHRACLHVPVLVCGWSANSFHEETKTLLVNAGGALLALDSSVTLGETIFLTNKATQQERECRVVYVASAAHSKLQVGAAFQRPAPHFWRSRRESRMSKTIRVKVRGLDRNRHPFAQSTYALDISRQGARIEGVGYLTSPGETIQVRRHLRTARFRVVWIGELGTPQAGQAGVFMLEPTKNLWGVTLPSASGRR